jgi:hypothetical protein
MKKIVFALLLFSLLNACNEGASESDVPEPGVVETPERDPSTFQYSIAIKSVKGEDLLNMSGGHFGCYLSGFIRDISPSQENVREQTFTVEEYENEYRITVKVECEKEVWDSQVETVLEFCVLRPGCNQDGIYIYDSLKCDINREDGRIICSDIRVNGTPAWKKTGDEEPFITFEKEYCLGLMLCSEDVTEAP